MRNQVFLIGRITKDIELRATKNGVNTANINIAVNREFKNNEGVYETDFINITTYQHIAEMVSEYCKKGDLIAIRGKIQTGNYYSEKEGKKVYTQEIIADKVSFLSSKASEIKEKQEDVKEEPKQEVNDPFNEFNLENQEELENLPF